METTTVADAAETPSNDDVFTVLRADGSAEKVRDPSLSPEQRRTLYVAARRARALDEKLQRLAENGSVAYVPTVRGEEVAITAAALALHDDDFLFPTPRDLGALLARGVPLSAVLAHVLSNDRDPSRGHPMPPSPTARLHGVASASHTRGPQLTHAVGYAWAMRKKAERRATLVTFDARTVSSAEFHNAANFAGVFQAPVVFVCRHAENATPRAETAMARVADKGIAYGVRGIRVDGSDALAAYASVREALFSARNGDGPTIVELVTRRDPDADADPIARMRRHLVTATGWTEADDTDLDARLAEELAAAVDESRHAAPPSPATIFEDVYGVWPWHLREQLDQL